MCWVAPLIPHGMYRSGEIFVPVWPTWSVCGRQPALVTAREQPTAPPSSSASSSIGAKPSAEPTPRPPDTTTGASASERPPVDVSTRSDTRTTRSCSCSSGANAWTAGASPGAGSIATACGATVMSAIGPSTHASSSRLPPQRMRVTSAGSPGVAATQFAASTQPATTAAWARRPASSATARPYACGAKPPSISATLTVATPWSPSAGAASAAPGPTITASTGASAAYPRANVSACSESSSGSPPSCSTNTSTITPPPAAGRALPPPAPRRALRRAAPPASRGPAAPSTAPSPAGARPAPPRAPLRRHRRIARQVEALEHRHDRRQRHVVDVAPGADLLLAPQAPVLHRDALQAGDARPPERVRDADPDLVVPVVGRLVAEHDQVGVVAGVLLGADRGDQRGGGRLRVPVGPVGDEVDRAVGAERELVAQLLLGLGGPERQHGRRAAVLLDDPDGLLDAALLVRADREAEVAGLDRALVVRQDDLAAGDRHALDADEGAHERMRVFSGSKSGVDPATATVTGYCSAMYSTLSCSPSRACSGGR